MICLCRSVSGPSHPARRGGVHLYRRYWMTAIIFIIGLLTLIVVFSWLGRIATADDPSLDLHQNPNVRVEEAG
ncbi:hypothetical protein PR048_001937 [Dryococelus australis]|uniref:Uncharacterized protein n=1 Tax=Dryococelus australis TaxID=614101 RepID=A0ABQ9IIS1_9NEOP|nr:hypothetical protein PR048_001937 [Dryococelus australis]